MTGKYQDGNEDKGTVRFIYFEYGALVGTWDNGTHSGDWSSSIIYSNGFCKFNLDFTI